MGFTMVDANGGWFNDAMWKITAYGRVISNGLPTRAVVTTG